VALGLLEAPGEAAGPEARGELGVQEAREEAEDLVVPEDLAGLVEQEV
jgi:hypothetical protein